MLTNSNIFTIIVLSLHVFYAYCAQLKKVDSLNILAALRCAAEVYMTWGTFIHKLVGMGSDGASVMLGANNGVAALLKKEQPALVTIHCFRHKLELAYKDSVKGVDLDVKVSVCRLAGLFYFYHNSPLNR